MPFRCRSGAGFIARWRQWLTGSGRTGWRGTWGWRRPGRMRRRRRDWRRRAGQRGAAGQAWDRGGYAATVTFLSRAAELSVEEGQRARRLLAAAESALIAGQPFRAGALLEEATPKLGDPLARAQARRLQGTLRLALGQAGEASSILLAAARAFEPT